MNANLKVVTQLPLRVIEGPDGIISEHRGDLLDANSIREALRCGSVIFFVADVGSPLTRIATELCFDFWKTEIQPHLVQKAEMGFRLEDYPDGYAYVASLWSSDGEYPVVLLETHH